MTLLYTTFHAGGILLQSMRDAFGNPLYWLPFGIILLYVMRKNGAWQRIFLHGGSLLALLLVHTLFFPLWGEPSLSAPSLLLSLLVLLVLLMWSGRTLFATLCLLPALCTLYGEINYGAQFVAYGISLLLSLLLYGVVLFLSVRIERDPSHFVSGEYTKGGYLVKDINLMLLFLFLTAFAIFMTGLLAFGNL